MKMTPEGAAIGHLVGADSDAKARTIMSYLSTNKLAEIVALRLPAKCAATLGALEFAPQDGAIWVTPNTVNSLVPRIVPLASSVSLHQATASRVQQYAEQKFASSAIAKYISRQLRASQAK